MLYMPWLLPLMMLALGSKYSPRSRISSFPSTWNAFNTVIGLPWWLISFSQSLLPVFTSNIASNVLSGMSNRFFCFNTEPMMYLSVTSITSRFSISPAREAVVTHTSLS